MARIDDLLGLGINPEQAAYLGDLYVEQTATGSTIADATRITGTWVQATSTGANQGLLLPSTWQGAPRFPALKQIIVVNGSGNNIKLYPPSASDQLNGAAAGAALDVAAGEMAIVHRKNLGFWNVRIAVAP